MDDLYLDGAHYDALYPNPPHPFWSDTVRAHGDPVLELGCGTGRILIPLAEAGFDATGIDRAPAMLDQARAKATEKSVPVRLVEADVRDFSLDATYRTILFPGNALCHIHTREDFEGLAGSVRSHLADDGIFAIVVFVPNVLTLARDPEGRYPYGQYAGPRGGDVHVSCSNRYDPATQLNHVTTYTQTGDDEAVEGRLDLRMYYPQELDALLHYNGFVVVERYGSLDREPFGPDAAHQVVLCRKR